MPPLLSVEEARCRVLAHVPAPRVETVPLAAAAGRIAAVDIASDADHPAFDRSRVDGYAVRSLDCATPGGRLRVVQEIPAGTAATAPLGPGEAARIFTGAGLPPGADAVVMQERCERQGDGVIVSVAVPAGDMVVPRGSECQAGRTVVARGDLFSPARIGAAASVGAAEVSVYSPPCARVIATGDELVPVESQPAPGQIRNGNAPAIAAALAALGVRVDGVRHARDTDTSHRDALSWALESDLVVTTGGVSVGDHDLVPAVLASLGAERVLHGVRQQPGKPLWFGTRGETLVFGLPGNPVSALVTLVLFVAPAVRAWVGCSPGPAICRARLASGLRAGGRRRRHDPVRLSFGADGHLVATPVPFAGSGDIFGFAAADALAVVEEDAPAPQAGEHVDIISLGALLP